MHKLIKKKKEALALKGELTSLRSDLKLLSK